MRERLKRAAPYITWLGLFVLLVGLLLPLLLRPGAASVPTWLSPAVIIVGAVLALAWPVLGWEDFREMLGGRRARFGGNALILTVSVIGVLAVLNYLASLRYAIADTTSNRQYSISRQSVQIVDDLNDQPEKVTLTAIVPPYEATTGADLERLMDRYLSRTDRIDFQLVDPQVDRLELISLAERLELGENIPSRALVAEMAGRHAIVYSGFDEQAVTEAIVKVMRSEGRRILFTTGHGEYDPNGGGDRSYNNVREQLEREGFTVEVVNLATMTETLSADTVDALVVAGPRQPFLEEEAATVADLVADGGAAMLLLDPTVDANLASVMAPWGVSTNDDLVLQQNILGIGATVVVQGEDYGYHEITSDLTELRSVFPEARSLATGEAVTTSLQTTAIVNASRGAWGETDLEGIARGEAEQGPDDNPAPLALAVVGESTAVEGDDAPRAGRLAVYGSSSFVADAALTQLPPGAVANFDLFLNTVSWLAKEEQLISIRPTDPDDRPMEQPSNPIALLLVSAVVLPLAVLGVGTYIYWRRH